MNDIIKDDLNQKIIELLLKGDDPVFISRKLDCPLNMVMAIMGSESFREICKENIESLIVFNGLAAVKRIEETSRLSTSELARLGAAKWLADNALNINKLGIVSESPSTMSQDQLARRLKDLQKEAVKRAIPIDTGVIEHDIDKMME
jgi:hypothetical protein